MLLIAARGQEGNQVKNIQFHLLYFWRLFEATCLGER